eukprot:g3778.t1
MCTSQKLAKTQLTEVTWSTLPVLTQEKKEAQSSNLKLGKTEVTRCIDIYLNEYSYEGRQQPDRQIMERAHIPKRKWKMNEKHAIEETHPTAEITLLSSVHGKDRRNLRSIDKHDLQAAVKYGTKELQYGRKGTRYEGQRRWKYVFANIVYITDEACKTEITSYALPLEIEPLILSSKDMLDHEKLSQGLRQSPQHCTSHTVLLIDQSGSMKTCDVNNFRHRSDAVYGTLALDLIGKRLDMGSVMPTEAVSIIEMRTEPILVFHRESFTNALYNKLLQRKKECGPRGHGKFLPALEMAAKVIQPEAGRGCHILFFFLSDGKPSDHHFDRTLTRESLSNQILSKVKEITSAFGSQLEFATVGFGKTVGEFSLLQDMARVAAGEGASAQFFHASLSSDKLSATLASLATSLTQTITRSTVTGEETMYLKRDRRKVKKEHFNQNSSTISRSILANPNKWSFYRNVKRLVWVPARKKGEQQFDEVSFVAGSDVIGLAIYNSFFGEGAERLVCYAQELRQGKRDRLLPAGSLMAAKESKWAVNDFKKTGFHVMFCLMQTKASQFATIFNSRMDRIFLQGVLGQGSNILMVPWAHIEFLHCYVYQTNERSVLVEPLLDQTRYKKYNSNDGYVENDVKVPSKKKQQLFEINRRLKMELLFEVCGQGTTAVVANAKASAEAISEAKKLTAEPSRSTGPTKVVRFQEKVDVINAAELELQNKAEPAESSTDIDAEWWGTTESIGDDSLRTEEPLIENCNERTCTDDAAHGDMTSSVECLEQLEPVPGLGAESKTDSDQYARVDAVALQPATSMDSARESSDCDMDAAPMHLKLLASASWKVQRRAKDSVRTALLIHAFTPPENTIDVTALQIVANVGSAPFSERMHATRYADYLAFRMTKRPDGTIITFEALHNINQQLSDRLMSDHVVQSFLCQAAS